MEVVEALTDPDSADRFQREPLVATLRADSLDLESAPVFRFDSVFGPESREFVQSVSDHYPVAAGFRTSLVDDDP